MNRETSNEKLIAAAEKSMKYPREVLDDFAEAMIGHIMPSDVVGTISPNGDIRFWLGETLDVDLVVPLASMVDFAALKDTSDLGELRESLETLIKKIDEYQSRKITPDQNAWDKCYAGVEDAR